MQICRLHTHLNFRGLKASGHVWLMIDEMELPSCLSLRTHNIGWNKAHAVGIWVVDALQCTETGETASEPR